MLLSVLFPLLTSWLFKKIKFKRIYLTYFVSGGIVLVFPVLIFIIRALNAGVIDPASIAFDKASLAGLAGNSGLMLFLSLFFQFVFNKTMKLSANSSNSI